HGTTRTYVGLGEGDEAHANNLHGIARIYVALGDFQTAVFYFKQSIGYRIQHNQMPDWGNFDEIHSSYKELKKYDSALYYLNYAIASADVVIRDSVFKLATKTGYLINKAILFDNNKQYDSAKYYYYRCLSYYRELNNGYMFTLIA